MSGPPPPSQGYGETMVGRVLAGIYRLVDLIGTGGFADVYLARDLRSNVTVAVKILHPHVAREPGLVRRFNMEAEVARRLTGPNVTRVLDSGQEAGVPPYFVMEYVQGLPVTEIIRRRGALPIPEAVRLVDQMLSALGEAHGLGIVHRDIKPANMILGADGIVKVMDFGIARVLDRGTVTTLGHVLGTPAYMAPEQVTGQHIDFRADLYAVGILLYELLAGQSPFGGSTDPMATMSRVLHEAPAPVQSWRPDIPPALASVLDRALAKTPERRFQSAGEMRQALATAIGAAPPPPTPNPVGTSSLVPPAAAPRSPLGTPPIGSPPYGTPPIGSPPIGSPPIGSPPFGSPSIGVPPVPGQRPPGSPPQYPPGPPTPFPPPQPLSGRSGPTAPARQGPTPPFPPAPTPPYPPMPSGQSGRSAMVPVLAVVGVLLLLVLGGAVGLVVSGAMRSPTPTATPVPVAAAPATATPAATGTPNPQSAAAVQATATVVQPAVTPVGPTATLVPPTATPVPPTATPAPPTETPPPPTATLLPRAVLQLDFTNDAGGLFIGLDAEKQHLLWQGEYAIKTLVTRPKESGSYVPGSYADAVLSVATRIIDGADYAYIGLGCRAQSTPSQKTSEYDAQLTVTPPRVRIIRWDESNLTYLTEWKTHPAIRSGDAANRFELRCVGTTISVAVNGQEIVSVQDDHYSQGRWSIAAGTFGDKAGRAEGRFDNLEVRTK